jgi:8-amino-7-oxononanoate synthase
MEKETRERIARSRDRHIEESHGLDFCSNDYLGLRLDPRLMGAAARAALEFGAGSGGARLLRGTSPVHIELERELALWKGTESCLLFNTGYQCNATIIPALLGPSDAVFSDTLNHASIVDGCRMARSRGTHLGIYRHRALGDLDAQLLAWRRNINHSAVALVVTDCVFSMDGDVADLPALLEICRRHQALLMVDEAHATRLLGETGAGLVEHQGVMGQVPLIMGTLGKALGSFGAFVACEEVLMDHLVNTSRGFIFSTSLPPAPLGAALAAVRIAKMEPWRRKRALGYARQLREALHLPDHSSAIVPILAGEDAKALVWAARLQEENFDVRAVRPPTVPEGQSRLRITTGAHLEDHQVDALIEAVKKLPGIVLPS